MRVLCYVLVVSSVCMHMTSVVTCDSVCMCLCVRILNRVVSQTILLCEDNYLRYIVSNLHISSMYVCMYVRVYASIQE